MVRNRRLPPEGSAEREQVRKVARGLEQMLVDRGMIVEGGWAGFKSIYLNGVQNQNQITDMRVSFFAGANHLFSSMMNIMEADREPTEKDMKRMAMIAAELEDFERKFKAEHNIE